MQIQAIDLMGAYEIKLANLEKTFQQLAEAATRSGSAQQRSDVAEGLEEIIATRQQFDPIKAKYVDDIEKALQGNRIDLQLTPFESRVVNAISDMYENVRAVASA